MYMYMHLIYTNICTLQHISYAKLLVFKLGSAWIWNDMDGLPTELLRMDVLWFQIFKDGCLPSSRRNAIAFGRFPLVTFYIYS